LHALNIALQLLEENTSDAETTTTTNVVNLPTTKMTTPETNHK